MFEHHHDHQRLSLLTSRYVDTTARFARHSDNSRCSLVMVSDDDVRPKGRDLRLSSRLRVYIYMSVQDILTYIHFTLYI